MRTASAWNAISLGRRGLKEEDVDSHVKKVGDNILVGKLEFNAKGDLSGRVLAWQRFSNFNSSITLKGYLSEAKFRDL